MCKEEEGCVGEDMVSSVGVYGEWKDGGCVYGRQEIYRGGAFREEIGV